MPFAKRLGMACLVLVGIGIWAYLMWPGQEVFGGAADPSENRSFFVLVYGFGMTLLGVVLGSIYRNLSELESDGRHTIGNPRAFFRRVFLSIDLWKGLCGAPILFALILRSTEGVSLAGLTTIALENGFCCTVILANLTAGRGERPESAADLQKNGS